MFPRAATVAVAVAGNQNLCNNYSGQTKMFAEK
jgi:hypothetical protein